VRALVMALPADGSVDVPTKRRLAQTVRAHYRAHPEALQLQARGAVLPPTVANHR
jgi:coproporphyrinogen III oxidase